MAFVANPKVIYRSLPDGAVLFSTVDEVYFGLNSVAARVWELLPPATRSLDELCDRLQPDYPDVAPEVLRGDVRALLHELADFGLIQGTVTENEDATEAA